MGRDVGLRWRWWVAAGVLAAGAAVPCRGETPPPAFAAFHATGIYDVGERAGWSVTPPEGVPPPAGRYTYTVKRNGLDVVRTGAFDLAAGPATIEVPSDVPGMMYVQVTPPAAAATTRPAGGFRSGTNYALTLGAAIAPAKLRPSAPRPADFDAFWDGKLRALAAVPIHPRLTPQATATPGVELSVFEVDSLGSHAHGYVAKPAGAGRHPALVLFQWAGVYKVSPAAAVGRAAQGWLCLNVDSHDVVPDSVAGVPQGYASVGNADREASYFLAMYLRDARAVEYLKGRPDWDGKTLVLMGTSMGGQQTLVTAGLAGGVTAALAWVPSGTDFDGPLHGRRAGYPNWNPSDPRVAAAGLYFDVVNFAPRITAPTFVGFGFIDTVSSPVGIWTAYNQIPGPKEAVPMPRAAHNNQAPPETERAWTARSEEVLASLRRGERVSPRGVPPP